MKALSIVAVVLGVCLTYLGTRFRIQHYPYGKEMMYTGLILMPLGVFYLIYRVVTKQKRSS